MVFDYYNRLSAKKQSVYRQSDAITAIRLPDPLPLRPSDDWGELHGLYLPEEDGKAAKIQLWMRTAKHKRVVAYKSFLRTLLHEVCHHLDYEFYKFPETFHTEGFYSRESSLLHQLAPATGEPGKVT